MTDDTNSTDRMFEQLLSIEPSVTKANQKVLPNLMKLFADFKEKLLYDIQGIFDQMVFMLKEECTTVCNLKNEKIDKLETQCKSLQEKIAKLEEKLDDKMRILEEITSLCRAQQLLNFK